MKELCQPAATTVSETRERFADTSPGTASTATNMQKGSSASEDRVLLAIHNRLINWMMPTKKETEKVGNQKNITNRKDVDIGNAEGIRGGGSGGSGGGAGVASPPQPHTSRQQEKKQELSINQNNDDQNNNQQFWWKRWSKLALCLQTNEEMFEELSEYYSTQRQ